MSRRAGCFAPAWLSGMLLFKAFEEQRFLVFASRGLVLDSGIMAYICTVKSRYQDHLR